MAELTSLGISVICHHFSACQCTSAPPFDWSAKKKKNNQPTYDDYGQLSWIEKKIPCFLSKIT
jgi:hypothetical protein